MEKIRTLTNKLFLPICAFIYLAIVVINFTYACHDYFWYDEAGQFWISKGLGHFSEPLSRTGSLKDVIQMNQTRNLDPGGFGVILHYWSMVSNNYVWLRVLPYLFFIGIIISIVYLTNRWTKNKAIAAMMGLLTMCSTFFAREMFELRAYSMEALGVVSAIIILEHLKERITVKRLLLSSIILSCFMTSRYSFIVVAFVVSTYVLYLVLTSSSNRRTKLLMMTAYAIPMMITLIGIYYFALRWQNPKLEQLSYLPYLSENPEILLQPMFVLYLLGLLLILSLMYLVRKTALFDKYKALAYVTIATNVLFLVFSIMGSYPCPWGEEGIRRCISMRFLVYICSIAFLGETLKYIMEKADIKYILLVVLFVQFVYPAVVKDYSSNKYRKNPFIDFKSLPYDDNARIYVDWWETPGIRYLFEYGSMRGKYDYPEKFEFAKKYYFAERLQELPYMNDLQEFDILIAPRFYRFKPENSDMWESVNGNNQVWLKKARHAE